MFSDNLKKFRTAKGFSQNDVAEKLFVTRQCVSKWEKGVTQPDIQTLTQLSVLLDVSVDELIGSNEKACSKQPANHNVAFFIANVIISVFCLIAFTILQRFLPQSIPAHWTDGVIDRYGSSNEIFLHAISVATFFAIDVVIFFIIKKNECIKTVAYLAHGLTAFFLIAYFVLIVVLYAKYITNAVAFITCLCIDLIMCVSIAMHPKISKQNVWLGVRTKATLQSAAVWAKTNALACYLFTSFSAVILLINMLWISRYSLLFLLIYVLLAVVVVVYAEKLGKSADK